jgi:hypothetical protein
VTTLRESPRLAAGFAAEVSGQIFAVGLALQQTAAITVDPLVGRRIDKALDDLDKVVTELRDDAFGPGPHPDGDAPPGTRTSVQDGQDERVPHWLNAAEDALDAATTAMLRIRELDDQWRTEFDQDRGILGDKLAILRTLMNGT